MNTKERTKEADRKESLARLLASIGCKPSELKSHYPNSLKEECKSINEVEQKILSLREAKYEESRFYGIDPNDTSVAFLEEWAREYLSDLKKGSKNEIVEFMRNLDESSKKEIIDAVIEKTFGGPELSDEERGQKVIDDLNEYEAQFEIKESQLIKIKNYFKYIVFNGLVGDAIDEETYLKKTSKIEFDDIYYLKVVYIGNDYTKANTIHHQAKDYFDRKLNKELSIFSPLHDKWEGEFRRYASLANDLK